MIEQKIGCEKTRFIVTEGRCEAEELEEAVVYGIALYKNDKLIAWVKDISADRSRVERLAKQCARCEVTEITFFDVIEDSLLY